MMGFDNIHPPLSDPPLCSPLIHNFVLFFFFFPPAKSNLEACVSLGVSLHGSVVDLPGPTLEEMDSLSSCQLLRTPQLEVELCFHIPSSGWSLICLELMQGLCMLPHCYDFVLAAALLCPKDTVALHSSPLSASCNLSSTSSGMIPQPLEMGLRYRCPI